MNTDAIRNALAAAGVVMTLGAGIISVKVDIATLSANVDVLKVTVAELKSEVRDIQRSTVAWR